MSTITRKSLKTFLFVFIVSISTISCANDDNEHKNVDNNTAENGDDTIKDLITHGEQAHENHCYKCHTDDVYTRENRFVNSIEALSKQVVRCKDGSDVPWFDEDTDAVVQFLNKKYYRF